MFQVIGEVILETRGLGCRANGVDGVSISVRSGEILGLAGLVGSGRTQLAETRFGLNPADSGVILLRGKEMRIAYPCEAIDARIGYVPRTGGNMAWCRNANREYQPRESGGGIAARDDRCGAGEGTGAQLRGAAAHQDSFDLFRDGLALGGNQQKVALSRWLAIRPSVLILDEPTQGVDVGSKAEIHRVMVDLAEQGVAIIMISSELPEILGMSDRIAVMHGGQVAGVLSREEATLARILSLALGEVAA